MRAANAGRIFQSTPRDLFFVEFCSVLEGRHFGVFRDFEIWAFKVFFTLDQKKGPKEGL